VCGGLGCGMISDIKDKCNGDSSGDFEEGGFGTGNFSF